MCGKEFPSTGPEEWALGYQGDVEHRPARAHSLRSEVLAHRNGASP